jgi:hypothetical protein
MSRLSRETNMKIFSSKFIFFVCAYFSVMTITAQENKVEIQFQSHDPFKEVIEAPAALESKSLGQLVDFELITVYFGGYSKDELLKVVKDAKIRSVSPKDKESLLGLMVSLPVSTQAYIGKSNKILGNLTLFMESKIGLASIVDDKMLLKTYYFTW